MLPPFCPPGPDSLAPCRHRGGLTVAVYLTALAGLVLPARGDGLFHPKGTNLTALVFISDGRLGNDAQKTLIATLQGQVARSSGEQIYITQSGSIGAFGTHLQSRYQLPAVTLTDPWAVFARFQSRVSGYVLYDRAANSNSLNAATSLCGPLRAVAVDASLEATVRATGLTNLLADVRGRDEAWVYTNYGKNFFSRKTVVEQTETIGWQLRDYAVLAEAFTFYDRNSAFRTTVMAGMDAEAACFGYGTDEATFVGDSSRQGVWVVPSDWAENLSTLSSVRDNALRQNTHEVPWPEAAVHYVSFVLTDGDNVAYDMASLYDRFNHPARGRFSMGYTISPSLVDVAPSVMRWYYESAATNAQRDFFVAGPSGSGYCYPSMFPPAELDLYVSRLNALMGQADLNLVTILDFSSFSRMDLWNKFAAQPNIEGLLYWEYAPYNGAHGAVRFTDNGKPVIGAREMLWSGLEEETNLIANLRVASRDPATSGGYSLVAVHTWSKDLGSVLQVVTNLAPDVRVVTPEVLARLIRRNLGPGIGLSGTILGTTGSYTNNPNTTRTAASDGNVNSYFYAPSANGAWVGLDLGSAKTLTKVRYCPRGSYANRMVGGKFQGANASDFSGAVDLFTISSAPVEGLLTTQVIGNTNGFRYVRYLSPSGSYGNVAEVEFYGANAAAGDPFLGVSGLSVRDAHGSGDAVPLRGVNLGGWLLMEPWMTPMDSSGLADDYSARQTLQNRFGVATCDSLLATYQQTWITTNDLDNVRAAGMNLIRLPFWYRNLEDEDGTWRADAFDRLDWLVTKAWQRGLYTILDCHGAVGGQSGADTTGRARGGSGEYWTDPTAQGRTSNLWFRIATHFRGYPGVAGYDVLNEPTGAPSRAVLLATYNSLYKTIRAADPEHLVVLEGCWGNWNWDILLDPKTYGWSNVVYEMHSYNWNWNDTPSQISNTDGQVNDWKAHQGWGVPCYIGEFNVMAPAPDPTNIWKYTLRQFESNNMNWSVWAYKAIHGTGTDSWGFYNPVAPLPAKPDLQRDDVETIRNRWSQWGTRAAFAINPMLRAALARPLPMADSYNATAAQTLIVNRASGVLANDQDLNLGQPGVQFSASLVDGPTHGQLTLLADGSFSYTPVVDYRGPDSFRYRLFDGQFESAGLGVVSLVVATLFPPQGPSNLTAVAVWSNQFSLTWTDNAGNEAGFMIERKIGPGGAYSPLASTGANATNYLDNSVLANTTYYYRVRATNAAGASATSNEAGDLTPVPLPNPWRETDLGTVGLAGGTVWKAGLFTVKAAGADLGGTADAGHLVYQPASGDCEVKALVTAVSPTDPQAKAGVLIRETLEANARSVFLGLTPSNGFVLKRRTSPGGSSGSVSGGAMRPPYWVRVTRTGDLFRAYTSSDGNNWTAAGNSLTLSMATNTYLGLAVTARTNTVLNTSTFSNVWAMPLTPTLRLNLSGTDLTVRTAGLPGLSFVLETTTNLVEWVPVSTNLPTAGGEIAFTNRLSVLDRGRFFRLRYQ